MSYKFLLFDLDPFFGGAGRSGDSGLQRLLYSHEQGALAGSGAGENHQAGAGQHSLFSSFCPFWH